MGSSRWAQIGDMIIHKDRDDHEKCVGIVTRLGKRGGSPSVFIEWSTRPPWYYNPEYGYAAVNIHNCFNEFEIIKAG
jgi:hypothetical protein